MFIRFWFSPLRRTPKRAGEPRILHAGAAGRLPLLLLAGVPSFSLELYPTREEVMGSARGGARGGGRGSGTGTGVEGESVTRLGQCPQGGRGERR